MVFSALLRRVRLERIKLMAETVAGLFLLCFGVAMLVKMVF